MQLTVAGIVLSKLGLYLVSNCHGVQIPAHPPLSILANAAVASSGTWQMLLWHQVVHATAIPSGIISLCIQVNCR